MRAETNDVDTLSAAATGVEAHGFAPFDAFHLVESDGDTVVSSDETYDGFVSRADRRFAGEE